MNYQFNLRLALAFLIALILTILPLPSSLSCFRPPWVLLVILYIQFFLPSYFSVMVTILSGLCLDLLLSTLMGEHMIALAMTTWIASTRVRRFHLVSLHQQMAMICALSLMYQLMLYLIDTYQGFNHALTMLFGTSLVSLIVWPWISLTLDHCFYMPKRHKSKWA